MMITSLQNERVKNWLKLKEKKFRDVTNSYLIEGDHLLTEALKMGVVKEIISSDNICVDGIPSYQVSQEILKKISDQVSPAKVLAVCKKKDSSVVNGPVLLLDGIQDPGNLGTIIRSAVAFSIPNIVLSLDTVDLYNPKVIRSTEGMHFHVNIIRADLEKYISVLKEKKYQIYTTNVHQGNDLERIPSSVDIAFIIGSEGSGVKPQIASLADEFIKIPMSDRCESLNAGVSASIIMYEYRKKFLK